jgi:hypothetical protein
LILISTFSIIKKIKPYGCNVHLKSAEDTTITQISCQTKRQDTPAIKFLKPRWEKKLKKIAWAFLSASHHRDSKLFGAGKRSVICRRFVSG